jgi:enediyne biosynthesis protein CalE5
MVRLARERAAGRPGVDYVVGDVGAAPGGHDVVLSRWALPLVGDLPGTLRALRAALVPGGVLAAAVWGPPQSVPMIALGFATVSRHLALDPPPPGGPGPFALADPEALRDAVAGAGFRDVEVTAHMVDFRLDAPEVFARFTLDVLPPRLRGLLGDDLSGVRAALVEAAVRHVGPDGRVSLPSVCLCVRGVA